MEYTKANRGCLNWGGSCFFVCFVRFLFALFIFVRFVSVLRGAVSRSALHWMLGACGSWTVTVGSMKAASPFRRRALRGSRPDRPNHTRFVKNSQNGTFLHFCRRIAAIKFKSNNIVASKPRFRAKMRKIMFNLSVISVSWRSELHRFAPKNVRLCRILAWKNVQLIPQNRTEFKWIKANHCELTCIVTQLFNGMNVLFNVLFRIKPHFFTILSLFCHPSRTGSTRRGQARTPRPVLSWMFRAVLQPPSYK